MARRNRSTQPDGQVQQILDILTAYERAHPQAQIEGRRHNPVSIRLRIIDPDFRGMDRIAREPAIWKLLSKLPEEVFVNITMLLLLTPEETNILLRVKSLIIPFLLVFNRVAKHLRAVAFQRLSHLCASSRILPVTCGMMRSPMRMEPNTE